MHLSVNTCSSLIEDNTTVTHLNFCLTTSAWRELNVLNTWKFRPVMKKIKWHLFIPKLIKLRYHRFSKYAKSSALFQLYLSCIGTTRAHLEYESDVWDPHLQKDITLIEVGLKICAKQLDLGHDELMSNFDVCMYTLNSSSGTQPLITPCSKLYCA